MILFLFLSSGTHQSHHILGYHVTSMNFLINSFLNALCCLNLFRQAIGQNNYCQDGELDLKSSRLKTKSFF